MDPAFTSISIERSSGSKQRRVLHFTQGASDALIAMQEAQLPIIYICSDLGARC
jgi:hypothetical protein